MLTALTQGVRFRFAIPLATFAALCFVSPPAVLAFGHGEHAIECLTHADNNAGLQAVYNRLGIAEAVAVQSSRPPLPIFSFDDVSTSIELDIERKVVASILSLATWPTRSKIARVRIEQAELRAAEDALRLAADTRKAYIRAVAAREILSSLSPARPVPTRAPCSWASSPRRVRLTS
jgi:hypothetical protein